MKNEDIVNETETSELNAALNYVLNKYMPILLISFLMFYSFGFNSFIPYFVIGLVIFSNKYSFMCGYADAILSEDLQLDIRKKNNYLSKDEY